MSGPAKDDRKVLVRNRKARHDYEILDTFEAGLALLGSEVKSLRQSEASLTDAYAEIRGGEAWLVGAQINPYPWANQFNHEPRRDRKLLLHRREIARLAVRVGRGRGFTLIPLEIYLLRGLIKVAIALARGKRQFEKREAKREAEAIREMAAAPRRR